MRSKEEILKYAREYWHKNKKRLSIRAKEYYLKNKKRINERNAKYQRKHREDSTFRTLKCIYGITKKEYFDLLIEQENCCAICKVHIKNFKKKLCVDHDHKTGKVRGLLCHTCNLMVGYAKDNINLLNASIQYISKYRIKRS